MITQKVALIIYIYGDEPNNFWQRRVESILSKHDYQHHLIELGHSEIDNVPSWKRLLEMYPSQTKFNLASLDIIIFISWFALIPKEFVHDIRANAMLNNNLSLRIGGFNFALHGTEAENQREIFKGRYIGSRDEFSIEKFQEILDLE